MRMALDGVHHGERIPSPDDAEQILHAAVAGRRAGVPGAGAAAGRQVTVGDAVRTVGHRACAPFPRR